MTRHVVVLNHFALPRNSAGGTRHVEMFGLLSSRWTATVIAGDRNLFDQSEVRSQGILQTVRVTPYTGNGVSRVVNWVSFALSGGIRALRDERPAVVYGSSPHMLSALAGWVIARLRRAGFVLEIRDLWPQILLDSGMMTESSFVYRCLKGLERFLYQRADAIIVLASGSIGPILAEGIDEAKIYFVPNGADPSDFAVEEEREALRSEFGFNRFTAVYAGAHGPANGLDLVLQAAIELEAEGLFQIVLFGDGVEKSELVERAKGLGLKSIEFRDPVPKEQIKRVLAAADVGLHSLADIDLFKHGVSPNKLYDYMAAGLPALTNTGGDVARMVETAGSGIAVDPAGIAEGMRTIAAMSEAERSELGHAGRSFMWDERSRAAMAGRVEQVLDRVAR